MRNVDLLIAFEADPTKPIQLPLDTEAREALFDKIKIAIVNAVDPVAINRYVKFAWEVARQESDAECEAWANWCSGLALIYRQPRAALNHFEAARAYYHRTGQTNKEGRITIGIAGLLGQMGKVSEAEEAIKFSIQSFKSNIDPRRCQAFLNYSDILGRQGRYQEMIETAHHAENLARNCNQPTVLVRALINQGYAELCIGELMRAEPVLQEALQLAHDWDLKDVEGTANIDLAYLSVSRGDLFKALRYVKMARVLFHEAQVDIELATTAIEEARLYEQLKMLPEARKAAILAAEQFACIPFTRESIEARLMAVRLALDEGRIELARNHLDKVQELIQAAPPDWQALWRGYQAHPFFQHTKAQRQKALVQADAASVKLQELAAVEKQMDVDLIAASLSASLHLSETASRYERIAIEAHERGWPAFERLACEGLARCTTPAKALRYLQRAANLVKQQRQSMPVEELKANLNGGYSRLYGRLIEAQLEDSQPGAALQTLLEAKGGLWNDLSAPPMIIEPNVNWLRARSELSAWLGRLKEAEALQEQEYIVFCSQKVEQAKAAIREMAWQRSSPRAIRPLPSLEEVFAIIPTKACVVDYLVTETKIWACIFTKEGKPNWFCLGDVETTRSIVAKLGLHIAHLRDSQTPENRLAVSKVQLPQAQRLLAQLYQQLIMPLEEWISSEAILILSPDDFLFQVPWSALWSGETCLGKNRSLILTPSIVMATLDPLTNNFRSCSPPIILGYEGKPPLKYISEETAALQNCLPDARCSLPASRRDLLVDEAPRFLHIAAHAFVNTTSPLLSHIELEDDALFLIDAFDLPLRGTELVTLSACETGVLPDRGGLLLALAGTFLCAGAKAAIASLWPVDDRATVQFMTCLYASLQNGISLPDSIQAAQRQLRQADYLHPYYWATFQPICRRLAI